MADPPRPTIVIETVDKDGLSGTGEETSLASDDNFASKNDEDDDKGDPMAVPPAHQRCSQKQRRSPCERTRRQRTATLKPEPTTRAPTEMRPRRAP